MAKQYTNRPELVEQDPENWEIPEGMPAPQSESPVYAPGADTTLVQPSETPDAPHAGPQVTPPDPRLGMNPEGTWTADKVKGMFPGMFQDTSQWLDPREEAKKRMGLPYDASKKYDENKPVDVPTPGNPRNPLVASSRAQFEQLVFNKIGGNPFLVNPYDEVIKGDRDLPDLFNHVFQGQAVWSDLPKLDKDQRAYWEQIKKQHHERIYKEASGRKQQMEQAYKWMMGQWAYDQKQAGMEQARADKKAAAELSASGKAPPHMSMYNDDIDAMTLRERDKTTGEWREVMGPDGKPLRTDKAKPEDLWPKEIKFAQAEIKRLKPSSNPLFAMLPPGKAKDAMMAQLDAGVSKEDTALLKHYEQELRDFGMRAGKWKGYGEKGSAPAAAATAPAVAAKPPVVEAIAQVLQAEKNNDPQLQAYLAGFSKKYPEAVDRLEAARARLKQVVAQGSVAPAGKEQPESPLANRASAPELTAGTEPEPDYLVKEIARDVGAAVKEAAGSLKADQSARSFAAKFGRL